MKSKIINYKKQSIVVSTLLIVFGLLTACTKEETGKTETQKAESIISRVEAYQGYQRQVHQEEYDLYAYFVEREVSEELSEQEMEKKVKDYANKVNAVFHLANKFNLCEPYSYEVLKLRMEQENEIRKVKKEKGEAIYGLEQFTLEQFFQYRLDTVEADLRTYLEGQSDDTMIGEAQKYYEENKDAFRIREKVVYEMTAEGKNQTVTAERDQINFMGDADPGLADFLEHGELNERYEDIQGDGKREVIIKEITYNESNFESNKEAAVVAYINLQLYEELIQMVAENNPVEFRLNIE